MYPINIYTTEHHPSGTPGLLWYEMYGDEVYPGRDNPSKLKLRWFKVFRNNLYTTINHPEAPQNQKWYFIDGNKMESSFIFSGAPLYIIADQVFTSRSHPDGYSSFPYFEIIGQKLYPTQYHPRWKPGQVRYVINQNKLYPEIDYFKNIDNPCYDIKDNKIYTTYNHPCRIRNKLWFEIKSWKQILSQTVRKKNKLVRESQAHSNILENSGTATLDRAGSTYEPASIDPKDLFPTDIDGNDSEQDIHSDELPRRTTILAGL